MELKTHDPRLTLTNGSYHSLVNARKPIGIEDKSAYLIGTGIGSLAARMLPYPGCTYGRKQDYFPRTTGFTWWLTGWNRTS
ncbi:hypothetical protein MGH68_04530 [Erysipelothrix sp. D19-032]